MCWCWGGNGTEMSTSTKPTEKVQLFVPHSHYIIDVRGLGFTYIIIISFYLCNLNIISMASQCMLMLWICGFHWKWSAFTAYPTGIIIVVRWRRCCRVMHNSAFEWVMAGWTMGTGRAHKTRGPGTKCEYAEGHSSGALPAKKKLFQSNVFFVRSLSPKEDNVDENQYASWGCSVASSPSQQPVAALAAAQRKISLSSFSFICGVFSELDSSSFFTFSSLVSHSLSIVLTISFTFFFYLFFVLSLLFRFVRWCAPRGREYFRVENTRGRTESKRK